MYIQRIYTINSQITKLKICTRSVCIRVGFLPEETSFFQDTGRNWKKWKKPTENNTDVQN